jgi:dTDP-4-dehydrorhamnose 3,5-epimerase
MTLGEVKGHKLEKHNTRDIRDGHVNGTLIPVWRDWDDTIKVHPKMVYVTTVNPGEIKGPHLHIIRYSYFVCIKGRVVFIIKDNSGKYIEIESSSENPTLVEIPRNYASCHINLSDEPSVILSLVEPAWRPDNKDEHNITFDDYDWKKWKLKK